MRLLTLNNQGEISLTKDFLDDIQPYAILSHTWGADEEEVTFVDLIEGRGKSKAGYAKLQFCEKQARKDNLAYFWVDTCCIDKTNHVELSEAITSMFRWYRNASKCYVYLSDVSTRKCDSDNQTWELAFPKSRWFKRGWTLQELLAPDCVEFFSQEQALLGNKKKLERQIHEITGIPINALHVRTLSDYSVFERLRWAANRETKRKEDKAYCLLGILEVSMSFRYGGEEKEFQRLRKKIDKNLCETNLAHQRLLERLAYISEAPFNSYENQRHRPCLEHTRVGVVNDIVQWASGTSKQCIFWLKGIAGTGKSTVAISVALRLQEMAACMASFFFQRGFGDLAHARKLIPTLARQLCLSSPAYCHLVLDAIKKDPDVGHTANLRDQFEKLIVEPLRILQASATSLYHFFVIIDALDECDEEKDQRLLLCLLATTQEMFPLGLRVLVTSRPEWVILQGFQDMPSILHQDLNLRDVPRPVVDHDIKVFLEHELKIVQRDRSFPLAWPEDTYISTLVTKAAGLFIFAATACRYIAGTPWSAPQERLEEVCAFVAQNHFVTEELDQMYTAVLESFVKERYTEHERQRIASRFRHVVGSIMMLLTPLSVPDLFRLLQDDQLSDCRQLEDTLRPLYAVIDVPKDTTSPVQPLHLSLRDFLLDQDRCLDAQFQIDERQTHQELSRACTRLMSSSLQRNICQISSSTIFVSDIAPADIDKALPTAVKYACQHWVTHVQRGRVVLSDNNAVHVFLQTHFLHWVETMSLIGKISEAIVAVEALNTLVNESPLLFDFVHDCHRFLLAFRQVIFQTPGQIYQSALFFSPRLSIVRQTFADLVPTDVIIKPPLQESWTAGLQIFEGHRSGVNSVVFSPNDWLVASGSGDGTLRLWSLQTGKCRPVLQGHSSKVNVVIFSSDGQLVASGSEDGTVRLWDVPTGESRTVLEGHLDSVSAVVFSPDGRLVVSGSHDSTVRVWDAQTGKSIAILDGHADLVNAVVFSPDGQCVGSGSRDRNVQLWVVQSDAVAILEGHTSGVSSTVFSPDSQLMASGSHDYTIRLWDVSTFDCITTLKGHSDWVSLVAFSPDGQLLVSGSRDCTVRLWNVRTGEPCTVLEGHSDRVRSATFSPDGQLVASGSNDSTVRLWNVQTGESCAVLEGHSDWVSMVVFSSNGRFMASGSHDHTVRLWNVQRGDCRFTVVGHSALVSTVIFSHDGKLVASGSHDCTVRLWDVQTGYCRAVLTGHSDWVSAVVFSPDGQSVASGSYDGTIRLWNVQTGKSSAVLNGHSRRIKIVIFSPDSQFVVSGSEDRTVRLWSVQRDDCCDWVGTVVFSPDGRLVASGLANGWVRLWDVQTGQSRAVFNCHSGSVKTVVFSPDGKFVASGSDDGTVRLWDVQTGQSRAVFNCHSGSVKTVAFSPNGKFVASGSDDGIVRLQDVQTGQSRAHFEGHSCSVNTVAFSPDCKFVASGSDDGTVRLRDVQTGQSRAVFNCHSGSVKTVVFSPDGQLVASGSDDGNVGLWDVQTGQSRAVFNCHSGSVKTVVFSPDGQLVASGSDDGNVRLWDVQTSKCPAFSDNYANSLWRIFSSPVNSVVFSPDGQLVASGLDDSEVRVRDVQTSRQRTGFGGQPSRVNTVAFSPNGQLMVTGSTYGNVQLWDVRTGCSRADFLGHSGSVNTVVFSPDGQLVASGSDDGNVRLWDVQTGRSRAVLEGHSCSVNTVTFSPDGQLVASRETDALRLGDVSIAQRDHGIILTTFPQRLDFGVDHDILYIDGTAFNIYSRMWQTKSAAQVRDTAFDTTIIAEGEWLMKSSSRALWLPAEHRPHVQANHSNIVVFGFLNGRVTFLSLDSYSA